MRRVWTDIEENQNKDLLSNAESLSENSCSLLKYLSDFRSSARLHSFPYRRTSRRLIGSLLQ